MSQRAAKLALNAPNKVGQTMGLKGARTRQRIMEATAKLFAERSFGDVKITDVARAAQVAQPSFYNYFANVEEVIFALGEEISLEPLARYLDQDWSGPGGVGLARQMVEETFELWAEQKTVLALCWFLADKLHPGFPELRVQQTRALYKAFEAQIRRSQEAGRLARGLQPRLAGYECLGVTTSAALKYRLLRDSGFSHRHLVDTTARMVHTLATGIANPVDT